MGNYMVIHVFIFITNCHEFITNFYPFSTFGYAELKVL